MATICNHHVQCCLHSIRARGDNPETLLVRAGINPQSILDPQRRIHTEQVARLFRLVQLELGDEFMGFTPSPCKLGAFKTMCELVQQSRSLGELLEKAVSFYQLLTDDVVMAINIVQGNAVFSMQYRDSSRDPEHFLREFMLVIWHRFPSWYLGEAIRLRETRFSFARPRHHQELAVMFPGKLSYGHTTDQLVFDAAYLDKPLVKSAAELEYFVRNAPADVMTIPGVDNSLETQIERMIGRRSETGLQFPRLDVIAGRLGYSPQMLYRQLKAHGTSYQKIKDDIRREMAITLLMDQQLPVEHVSELVGFSEARSFTRAFRQWTGMSPRRYRQALG